MLESDLVAASGPIYRYDPFQRLIGQSEGTLIRGLITRRSKPEKITIPKPDGLTAVAVNTPTPQPAHIPDPAPPIPPEPAPEIVRAVAPPTPAPVETHVEPAAQVPPMPPVPAPVAEIPPEPKKTPPENVAARAQLTPIVLRQPDLPDAPTGSFVLEAEHFSSTTYGWEAHIDPACSGGVYFHCKEGIANNSAQVTFHVGNFYDVHSDPNMRTSLQYHFNLPKGGRYFCYGRMWTTDTHCSNHLCLDFDRSGGGDNGGSIDNRTPFRWIWTPISNDGSHEHDYASPIELAAGDHYFNIYIWEDGIRLDQFIFSPVPITGNQPNKPNLIPNHGTQFEKQPGPAIHLSADLKNAVIAPGLEPDAKLVIRKVRPATGIANVKVRLKKCRPQRRRYSNDRRHNRSRRAAGDLVLSAAVSRTRSRTFAAPRIRTAGRTQSGWKRTEPLQRGPRPAVSVGDVRTRQISAQ